MLSHISGFIRRQNKGSLRDASPELQMTKHSTAVVAMQQPPLYYGFPTDVAFKIGSQIMRE